MDSEGYVFDMVKFEKMKAMEVYNRFKKIKKLLLVLELLVAFTVISWSSAYLPQALKVSSSFLIQLADYLFKPHVVFLIGNVIVVALVVLCRQNDAGDYNSSDSGDIYEEYIHQSRDQQQRKNVSVVEEDTNSPTSPTTEIVTTAGNNYAEEKQIVSVAPSEEKLKHSELEKNVETEIHDVETAINDATKDINKFQRTQSVRLKRELAVKPCTELRRSETCRRSGSTSSESVESLSDEEFNLTVAAFIKRHQEFLMSQKLAEK